MCSSFVEIQEILYGGQHFPWCLVGVRSVVVRIVVLMMMRRQDANKGKVSNQIIQHVGRLYSNGKVHENK